MVRLRLHVSRFVADESGAPSVEYVLVASLIAVALVAGATVIGGKLASTFSLIASSGFK
jgi:pilus assembly protein Flp/PilA